MINGEYQTCQRITAAGGKGICKSPSKRAVMDALGSQKKQLWKYALTRSFLKEFGRSCSEQIRCRIARIFKLLISISFFVCY